MHPNWTWAENDVGSSISTCFINFFHIGAIFHCFPAILKSSTYTDRSNPCLRWANIHSQFGPYKFRSRGTTGSSILDHDLEHLCRGRRIQTFGHSEFGILSNLGASSNFTWELADTASAACPSQPGNLAMTSMIFAAVIWDADEPCSVKLRRLQSCLLQCPPEHVARLSSFWRNSTRSTPDSSQRSCSGCSLWRWGTERRGLRNAEKCGMKHDGWRGVLDASWGNTQL